MVVAAAAVPVAAPTVLSPAPAAVLPFPTKAERAAYVDALKGAAIVPGSEHLMSSQGKSGFPTKLRLQLPNGQLEAVSKPHNEGELRGQFAQDLLVQMGLDRMVPPSAVRNDRTITMLVHAKEARALGVNDATSLEATIAKLYATEHPELTAVERASAARRDTQLIQTFDYVTGLSDRHHRNILVDQAGHTFIHDNDGLGFGGRAKHPMEPKLSATYLPDGGWFHRDVVLTDDTRAWLKSHLTADDLRNLAKPYLAKDAKFVDPDTIEAMAQRLDHVLTSGQFRAKVSPWNDFQFNRLGDFFADHPLAHKIGTSIGKVFGHA